MIYTHPREIGDAVSSAETDHSARVLDVQRRQAVADLTVVPRCPRCRAPLVARMTCRGPSFACQCEEHRFG